MTETGPEGQNQRILFVDDERNILKSLQREFLDSRYEVLLAEGAEEALEIMEKGPVDILVTDYKMPKTDGLELLGIVRATYPSSYRVILSGFLDQREVLRALSSGLATSYLAKPWDPDAIHAELDHLFATRKMLSNFEIIGTVNSIEELPALTSVYREFAGAVDEGQSYQKLTRIIMQDVAITTKFLRIASSAYYHLTDNVSVERVLSYIGINAVKEVLIFSSLMRNDAADPEQAGRLQEISTHSMLVNCALSELYSLRFGRRLPEQYSSIGITHDIGKIIMLGHMPERYEAVVSRMAANPGTSFHESEKSLGFTGSTHAEIGGFFLDLWRLPRVSVEACLYHHDSEAPGQSTRDILEACRAADRLVNCLALDAGMAENELRSFLGDRAAEIDQPLKALLDNLRYRREKTCDMGT